MTRQPDPIAVIGMSCRLPGAPSIEAFWRLLREGREAITEVPADRWDVDAYYDPTPGTRGKMNTRWGGFLEQVDQFDLQFFGISPREAARLDPQQRLLLEVAFEALEDGGQVLDQLQGSPTGVFVGISSNDYGRIQMVPRLSDAYLGTGNAASIAANRISYTLGLRGPSLAIDTACSSALVAVHLACSSLRSGESKTAVVGGVNVILAPTITVNFTQAGMMSPEGRCRAFDAGANGYVRSEGAGVVILKPLHQARADGDRIHAVILGSAVNQDGQTSSLTVPNQQAQEDVVLEACRQAGVPPGEIDYVEAHGTGTPVGDPIEASALGRVLARGRPPDTGCAIGSVKTNIGHLEAAAGVAGLLKVILSLQHREIPPSLHFETPNPEIPFADLPLEVQRSLGAWPQRSHPPRAGVNSFGFGGTNAHVILEGMPHLLAASPPEDPQKPARLLPLSARSPQALRSLARALRNQLADEGPGSAFSLQDTCFTAAVRRTHHEHRLAVVVHTRSDAVERLDAFGRGESRPGMSLGAAGRDRAPPPVFVFCGQGPQWWAMGRQLLEQEPVFRRVIEQCDRLVREMAGWSLLEELTAEERLSRVRETEVAQPTLFALQVALAAQWEAWGILPGAVVGHSLGEVAAAHVAGVLTLGDAVRVILQRSKLMQKVTGHGRMAAAELSLEEATVALAPYQPQLTIATHNSARSVVFSGDSLALEDLLGSLQDRGVFTRLLPVDYAFHSTQMEPFQAGLKQALHGLRPREASRPIFSTLTGQACHGREFDADYWTRQIREPVRFAAALDELIGLGHDTFLELSPHPALAGHLSQCLRQQGRDGHVLASLRREEGERAVMLGSLGALHSLGMPVAWDRLDPAAGRCVPLPSYPWQRERCWVEVEGETRFTWEKTSPDAESPPHPFLRHRVPTVHPSWDIRLDTRSFPYLKDHQVQGVVMLPGAAYVEMGLAGFHEAFAGDRCVLSDIDFQQALSLSDQETRPVQVVFSPDETGETIFQVYCRSAAAEGKQETWTSHATGRLRAGSPRDAPAVLDEAEREIIQARCTEAMAARDLYDLLQECGLQYGPSFQGIQRLWRREGEVLAQLNTAAIPEAERKSHRLHPTILDACFQTVAAAVTGNEDRPRSAGVFLPVRIDRVRYHRQPGPRLWAHARLRPGMEQSPDSLEAGIQLVDDDGTVVAEVDGLHLRRLERDAQPSVSDNPQDWRHAVQWEPRPYSKSHFESEPSLSFMQGSWLIFTDGSGVGDLLVAQLCDRGERCIVVAPGEGYERTRQRPDLEHYLIHPSRSEDMHRLLHEALGQDRPWCRGVIHLWSLDATAAGPVTAADLETSQTVGCHPVLHLVQALSKVNWYRSPRLWLVTRGAQQLEAAPRALSIAQAPLWGLGRVIAHEHPNLRCSCVDLDPDAKTEEVEPLFQELWAAEPEDQIALRGGTRYVARMSRMSREAPASVGQELGDDLLSVPAGGAFRLEVVRPGMLDSLALRPTPRRAPGPGEVEIQVRAAGLNFRDVMKALGIYPTDSADPEWLGDECAGRIVAVGDRVVGLHQGDAVVAVAPGCLGSTVTVPASLVVHKPTSLSFAEAATIPIAFTTAYYSLHYLAHLRRGERVLIHAAAGGVGLAAVQIARRAGAEIYATAGSPGKRSLLQSLGVEHVMDSRSLSFGDEIMELTSGEGVDVVLNSLSGEAIARSLAVLRAYGRFLEIGKRDIYQNSRLGLRPFRNNLSFFAIDMAKLFRERTDFSASLLRETVAFFEAGTLQPSLHRVAPIAGAVGSFRQMAKGKHVGKLVLSIDERDVPEQVAPPPATRFAAAATYLITGGLGSLGLQVARWMGQHGARHLVLMGRSAPSAAAEATLGDLRESGVTIKTAMADVARQEDVDRVLTEVEQSMPPLRGVIHAAGILDDGILLQLEEAQFKTVMAPKVQGAWNLHSRTSETPLDFFVLFSSAASLLGSPGQGNYAAANAFLDALAHYRHAQGLPALSINWGPWAEQGMAARGGRGQRMLWRGLRGIAPQQGLDVLERLLGQDCVQVGVLPINWQEWFQAHPAATKAPFLSRLVAANGGAAGDKKSLVREAVLSADPDQRSALLESYVRQQIAAVLQIDPTRIEPRKPLNAMGLDSLMAVEFKTRVETDLAVTLPMVSLIEGPSITQLVARLLDMLTRSPPASALSMPGRSREQRPAPLSFSQEHVWQLQQLVPDSPLYSTPLAVRIHGRLEVVAINRSLNEIVRRHDVLRTTFAVTADQPVPIVSPHRDQSLPIVDLHRLPEADRESRVKELIQEELGRPFDLTGRPLLRVFLLRLGEHDNILVMNLHHLISDGWSAGVALREIGVLYHAYATGNPSPLVDLTAQYGDYARWQREWLQGETLDTSLRYWREQLAGAPVLRLPTDRPRPASLTFAGARHQQSLPRALCGALKELSQREGTTLFMTCLAAFQLLLHQVSGQDDLLVGSPIANRERRGTNAMIGYFANLLAVRVNLSGNPTFREFLGQVQRVCLEAYAHQELPLERLLQELYPDRDRSRHSLFQVTFALQNTPLPTLEIAGITAAAFATDVSTARFDLEVEFTEQRDGLAASFVYRTDLFDAATITGLATRFVGLLEAIAGHPDQRLSGLQAATRHPVGKA